MSGSADNSFPIVALGASAGVLKAFTAFFKALEATGKPPGMAFVVVPHLLPSAESHMAEILQTATRLPVMEIEGPTGIERDRVYVLRPDNTLGVAQRRLEPRKRAPGAAHHPVDDVFAALAGGVRRADRRHRFVGHRLERLGCTPFDQEAGGLVLAQTPETAEFGEMARRAIGTGLVDSVMPPERMIEVLFRHGAHLRSSAGGENGRERAEAGKTPEDGKAEQQSGQTPFTEILTALQRHTGLDFRRYKLGTLQRRIDRRVHLARLDSLSAYAGMLRDNADEVRALADDLLITVTEFFRDPEAWKTFRDCAIRPVIEAADSGVPIRAWVAGCASGEEAYTLAISLFEEARAQGKPIHLEIFATDASQAALVRARAGVYPAAAVQTLPQVYTDRYFEREDDRVRVKRELRETVIFAPQNLIQDPPFSRVDFVICRNVLIYMQTELQQKLVRLFHFALDEGGYLLLGSAESLGEAERLFSTVSKQWRLYRRQDTPRHDVVDFPLVERQPRRATKLTEQPQRGVQGPIRVAERMMKALANRYAPPSVVVDNDLNIIYHQGKTDRFLRPQSGPPTQNLVLLARDTLGPRLRLLTERVKEGGKTEREKAHLTGDDGAVVLEIEAAPLDTAAPGSHVLISFREERTRPRSETQESPPSGREDDLTAEVGLLRDEIATAAAANNRTQEELKSYNEEVMSMNEELRAANEELETSKEELQSLNEELNTVNSQLRVKVDQLHERTNDLSNLLSSTDIATLFLNGNLHIRWFSHQVKNLFNVRPSDSDRRITDLVQKFDDPAFVEDCETVLRTLMPKEREVKTEDGRWFVRRIGPYRTEQDRIEGVVVTFSDITAIQAAREYAEKIVETAPAPFIVLDHHLRVVSANPAFYQTFSVMPDKTRDRLIYDLGNGQWNIPELRRLLTEVLQENGKFSGYEVRHTFEEIGEKTMRLSGQRVDHVQLILLAVEDITESKHTEAQQSILMAELNHRVKNALAVVQALASQTLANAGSLDEFRNVFVGRLAALARGHSQLLERDWEGTELAGLVRDAVSGFDRERVEASGPEQELSSKKALALNLILHELETNAAKYGALSGVKGRIAVHWKHDGDSRIQLVWQESGGPPVKKPEKDGFGSRLIRQLTSYELDGEVSLRFEPEGLRCELTFPAR